jgi:hypothetical protein
MPQSIPSKVYSNLLPHDIHDSTHPSSHEFGRLGAGSQSQRSRGAELGRLTETCCLGLPRTACLRPTQRDCARWIRSGGVVVQDSWAPGLQMQAQAAALGWAALGFLGFLGFPRISPLSGLACPRGLNPAVVAGAMRCNNCGLYCDCNYNCNWNRNWHACKQYSYWPL